MVTLAYTVVAVEAGLLTRSSPGEETSWCNADLMSVERPTWEILTYTVSGTPQWWVLM